MILQQGAISLRRLEQEDAGLLVKWLSDERVLAYYEGRDRPLDEALVQEHFYSGDEEVERCMICYEALPIGYLQFYPVEAEERAVYGYADMEERIFGMDQFIGEPDYWNRGIGTSLIGAVTEYLLRERQADRIVMDPQAWNARALRVYEKAGFVRRSLLPRHEWHEGEMRDCWLIEYCRPDEFADCVTSADELAAMLGKPSPLVERKAISIIDRHCRDFIAKSPLLFLATSDSSGCCDVSPRGDQPGFVYVLGERRLVIPERPGNRRMESLRNIVANPHVGLIFVIPGLEETLRINGRATIVKDPALLSHMAAFGKTPLLGIGVDVEECYVHCAKAFKRSGLWQPAGWPESRKLPSVPAMLAAHVNEAGVTAETVARSLEDSYTNRLY